MDPKKKIKKNKAKTSHQVKDENISEDISLKKDYYR